MKSADLEAKAASETSVLPPPKKNRADRKLSLALGSTHYGHAKNEFSVPVKLVAGAL